jgi:hypothetical protein
MNEPTEPGVAEHRSVNARVMLNPPHRTKGAAEFVIDALCGKGI